MFSLFSRLFNCTILCRSLFNDWNSVPLVIEIPLFNDGLLRYLSLAFRNPRGDDLEYNAPSLVLASTKKVAEVLVKLFVAHFMEVLRKPSLSAPNY